MGTGVAAALEAGSVYLRERGLDEQLTRLARLQGQLPGLGLPLPAQVRWREDPVARAALRRLERFHVVRPAGDDYTVEIPLVARWVRERAEFAEAGVPIA